MKVPNSYYLQCPACGKETMHEILKGEVGTQGEEITIDGIVKCEVCGTTRHKTIREKKAIDVPIIVSWRDDSDRKKISLYPDEWIHKGDKLILDGTTVKVTSIEQEGKRVESSKVEDIKTIWSKKHDKVRVKVSVHKGRNSISEILEVVPEEEFYVNDQLKVGEHETVIHRIKTEDEVLRKGKAKAEDIVRIYTKRIR